MWLDQLGGYCNGTGETLLLRSLRKPWNGIRFGGRDNEFVFGHVDFEVTLLAGSWMYGSGTGYLNL